MGIKFWPNGARIGGAIAAIIPFSALSLEVIPLPSFAFLLYLGIIWIRQRGNVNPFRPSVTYPWLIFFIICAVSYVIAVVFRYNDVDFSRRAAFDFFNYSTIIVTIAAFNAFVWIDRDKATQFMQSYLLFYTLINGLALALFLTMGPVVYVSHDSVNYSPLARNIHHTAIGGLFSLFCVTSIFFARSRVTSWLVAPAAVVSLAVILLSGSSKAAASGLILFSLFSYTVVGSAFQRRWISNYSLPHTLVLILLVISAVIGLSIISGVSISDYVVSTFAEFDGKDGRYDIYSTALREISHRLFLGNGPGPHVYLSFYDGFGWRDAHSSVLTIILQGGIVGLSLFLFSLFSLLTKLRQNIYFLVFFSCFIFYFLFGDIHRSVLFWLGFVLAFRLGTGIQEGVDRGNNGENLPT